MFFFACRGFRKPPGPLKRGRRKAAQDLGPVGSRPVGWQPVGVPLLRGSGVSEIQPKLTSPVGQCPVGVPLLRGSGVSEIQPKLTSPVGQCPAGVPLLRGSGVSKPYLASIFPSLNQLTLFLNVSRNLVSIPAYVAVIDPHNHQPYSPHLPVSFLVAKTSFRREM